MERTASDRREPFFVDCTTLSVPEKFYSTSIADESTSPHLPNSILLSNLPESQSKSEPRPATNARSLELLVLRRQNENEDANAPDTGLAFGIEKSSQPQSQDYNQSIYDSSSLSGQYTSRLETLELRNSVSWGGDIPQFSAFDHAGPQPPFQTYGLPSSDAEVLSGSAAVRRSRRHKAPKVKNSRLQNSSEDGYQTQPLLRPRRRGPLKKHTRQKADTMRDMGACWRCRKYKKSVSQYALWNASLCHLSCF